MVHINKKSAGYIAKTRFLSFCLFTKCTLLFEKCGLNNKLYQGSIRDLQNYLFFDSVVSKIGLYKFLKCFQSLRLIQLSLQNAKSKDNSLH